MIVFLQARCSSKRFPGKVLKPLAGIPLVIFQINRILSSTLVEDIIVLTSKESSDDELCSLLDIHKIKYFRGELNDVNLRFRQAISKFGLKNGFVMRLTADCPLICPEILDYGISAAHEKQWEYLSNTVIRTFPDGLDFEILDVEAFLDQPRELMDEYDKEHVTPYFYKNFDMFSIGQLVSSSDYSALRLTVDYLEDLEFITMLIGQPKFSAANPSYIHLLELYNNVMHRRGEIFNLDFKQSFEVRDYGDCHDSYK